MVVIQVAEVIHSDGWQGSAAALRDIGMLDDATYLLSGLRESEGASVALALEPLLPSGGSELVVRSQRMCQGRSSGTGTPAPLSVVVHQGETQLLAETVVPGGSWREDRFGLPALGDQQTPLTVQLLVPAGERQVAVSRLRLEALAATPLEGNGDTQDPPVPAVVDSAAVELEPVDPEPVVAACEVAAACPAEPPAVKARKRARHRDGTYRGDDPATDGVNEAWDPSV